MSRNREVRQQQSIHAETVSRALHLSTLSPVIPWIYCTVHQYKEDETVLYRYAVSQGCTGTVI